MGAVKVNCQKCGDPMTIEVAPENILPVETLAKFATCASCMRRMGRAERPTRPKQNQREFKLPYKD